MYRSTTIARPEWAPFGWSTVAPTCLPCASRQTSRTRPPTTPTERSPPATPSDELDILIWLITQAPPDDDTATAAAALAWFYAGAKRSIGPPVWSNWALGYQPIGPLSPESWDSLAPFGLSHPVGLRTGRSDLDTAERRVAALHRRVLELAGPWQLTAHPDRGGFRLAGAAGPIGGQQVTITITAPGSAPTTSLVLTGADGYAAALVDPSAMADGATIDASLNAPGPHREWDGDGSVQRMITSTQVHLTARFEVAPAPRHVTVSKHSTDPTIGVADGVFALTDANGIEVERVVTDGNGRAWFAPIDPALHPQPYTVSEVEPPPGLAANATAVIVSDASTDAERPTVTEFTNEPLTAELVVRKELSAPVGPDDKSGFGFSIVRTQDGRSVEVSSDSTGTTSSGRPCRSGPTRSVRPSCRGGPRPLWTAAVRRSRSTSRRSASMLESRCPT